MELCILSGFEFVQDSLGLESMRQKQMEVI